MGVECRMDGDCLNFLPESLTLDAIQTVWWWWFAKQANK